jgi:DNA-binding CsgD family transcriptional regulator/Tfp pilus assembly protein PilF
LLRRKSQRITNFLELSSEAGTNLVASFQTMLACAVRQRGDYERAKELLEVSLMLSREADDKVGIADALLELAAISNLLDDRVRAKELFEEGVALCREMGYPYLLPAFLYSLGYALLVEGEYERGAALNEEAAVLFREHGYIGGLHYALNNLGWAALLRGHRQQARSYYEESLTLCGELNDKRTASKSLDGLVCVAGAQGEVARAARLFGAAEALRETVHEAVAFQHQLEVDAWGEPYLASARSRLGEAAWEEVLAQGQAMGLEEAIDYALCEDVKEPEPAALVTVPERQPSSDEPTQTLTVHEQEVALLVGRGLTNRQIAQELTISERTVENHIGKILKKQGFTWRA